MSIITTTVADTPLYTVFRDVDAAAGLTVTRTVWKAGTPEFNRQSLISVAINAITMLNNAEDLLSVGNGAWDAASPAQRNTLILALVRQNRALIRIVTSQLDSSS